jgi:hypothetical protein
MFTQSRELLEFLIPAYSTRQPDSLQIYRTVDIILHCVRTCTLGARTELTLLSANSIINQFGLTSFLQSSQRNYITLQKCAL